MANLWSLQFPFTAGQHVLVSRGETRSSGELQPATALHQHMLTGPGILTALSAADVDGS